MEILNAVSSFLSEKEFAIPLWEVIVFVIVISLCLLFGRNRLGLIISYSFVFYWGFVSNMTHFSEMLSHNSWGMPLYIFSGFLMFIVAITGFFVESKDG
jgi:hypothetical protein